MQPIVTETDEMFIKKGEMIKNPFTMNKEELAVWEKETNLKIRQRLFAIGQPLVYESSGKFVVEYANGRIETI